MPLGTFYNTPNVIQSCIGKTIKDISIDPEEDSVIIAFNDNTFLSLHNDDYSCCEIRWFETSDDLEMFKGDKFMGVEVKECPEEESEDRWCVHEVEMLEIKTDKGFFTFSAHNEHNGYYGGISIYAKLINGVDND